MQIFELMFHDSEKQLLTYLLDQWPSINIRFLPVSQLVKMNNSFHQYIQSDCFGKSLWSLYPCRQTIETKEQWDFSSISRIKFRSIVGYMR